MITRTAVASAAPLWVRDQLAGPVANARVIHVGTNALYVATTDGHSLAVLSVAASTVPCGLHTLLGSLHQLNQSGDLPALSDPVTVGAGRLSIGDADVHVGRLIDHSVPRFDAADAAAMAQRLIAVVGSGLDGVRAELPAPALAMLGRAEPLSVSDLLGRGSGLTPVGDDVLAGWLATMIAAGETDSAVARTVAPSANRATTTLSATLLERAAAGEVLLEFRAFLLQLKLSKPSTPDAAALRTSAHAMLAIGHTSGAGLVLGCLTALEHLDSRSPRL